MDQSSLATAVGWVQTLLLGEVGTAVAVLAVAFVGFGMLRGDLRIKDGARVVLGCFILFGAPAISRGMMAWGQFAPVQTEVRVTSLPQSTAIAAPPLGRPSTNPFDPNVAE